MRVKSRKKQVALLMVLSFIFCFGYCSLTAQAQTNQKKLHIVFALDVSGSMNNKDSEKTALEVIKMLSDICSNSDNELGFVAYNDTIAYSYDMTACNGEGTDKLKNYISSVKYGGETDIGLGLKEAVNMSVNHADEESDSIVILLSDGKTDLKNSDTNRTVADSEQDMDDALEAAKENEITIYPIRLNDKFDTKVDYLSQVAKSTKGESSAAFSPLELVGIIDSIVSRYQIPSLENVTTMSGNNDLQEVKTDLNTEYVDKTRIYVLSTGKVSYVSLVGADADVTYDDTKRYSIVEITDMEDAGSVKLYFRSKKKSEIQVYTQQFYSLEPSLNVEESVSRNADQTILFQFYDTKAKTNAEDEALYSDMQIQCTLVSLEDGSERGLSYKKTSQGIEIEDALSRIGDYELKIAYSGSYRKGTFTSDAFHVVSNEPNVLKDIEEKVCIKDARKVYDLTELLAAVKSEIAEYRILSSEGESVSAVLQDTKLVCTLNEAGDTTIVVQAADKNQDLHQITILLHAMTFWQMYQVVIVACAIGAIMLITLMIGIITVRKSKKVRVRSSVPFVGTLIGYFVNLKSANDLPALKWDLFQYETNRISMADLLTDIGIPDQFIGADKIWFYSKSNHSIELFHNLEGSIFVGTKMVSKDTPVTIYSGEKIFISFDENGVELELRFNI